jgi:hypothetical protein
MSLKGQMIRRPLRAGPVPATARSTPANRWAETESPARRRRLRPLGA